VAFFEVLPPEQQRLDNPYRAWVGGSASLNTGQIRVEPPFTTSETYLEYLEGNVSVCLEHMLTSGQSTLLRFEIHDDFGGLTNEARVRATVESLLLDLGASAVVEYFKSEHDGYEGTEASESIE
jgi:hypothetical protein